MKSITEVGLFQVFLPHSPRDQVLESPSGTLLFHIDTDRRGIYLRGRKAAQCEALCTIIKNSTKI